MNDKKILVIVPAYNEEKSILSVAKSLEKLQSIDYIIINDDSSDGTELVCQENNLPHVSLINNLGIGGAMQTGYRYAYNNGYEIAIQFDGDGQHNVKYIFKLIETLINQNCDLVIGSRFLNSSLQGFKSTKMRRIGIKIITILIKLVTGATISDPTSGFRACNRKIIKLFANNYPVEYPEPGTIVKLLKEGCIVKEILVRMNARATGLSSISGLRNFYYMLNVTLSILIEGFRKNG